MKYKVSIKKGVKPAKLPKLEQETLLALIEDLKANGPVQTGWRNFSKLATRKDSVDYHCHLTYHWVACWTHFKDTIEIEVYYAGSREKAPY